MGEHHDTPVRILYLDMDPGAQPPGYETVYAILDPTPSPRWRAAFRRFARNGPPLLRGVTIQTFQRKAAIRIAVPEQNIAAALQGLKTLVADVSGRTGRVRAVPTTTTTDQGGLSAARRSP
ncbi:hypothetical protein [Luteibacter sp. ME-Dv--P-043b]|uniref:hypothetical protein n=1 Tax=Luteibacter sp. ME-Dv--P-043b TaxID=3040291 RepID=UPI0025545419|nr:hypothetical protein [Luteibacter sp. ME-Dv--P-043b]